MIKQIVHFWIFACLLPWTTSASEFSPSDLCSSKKFLVSVSANICERPGIIVRFWILSVFSFEMRINSIIRRTSSSFKKNFKGEIAFCLNIAISYFFFRSVLSFFSGDTSRLRQSKDNDPKLQLLEDFVCDSIVPILSRFWSCFPGWIPELLFLSSGFFSYGSCFTISIMFRVETALAFLSSLYSWGQLLCWICS